MIPNTTYEAGFKSQFFTIVLISSSLIFIVWSFSKLIINYLKDEENQKQLNYLYQKSIDVLNYYLDDLKYIEDAINYLQKKFRHKQVYESIVVEDGLITPRYKKNTIYCQEYFNKVVEKHKADKKLYSDVSIYLTLANGITLSYIPRYPWYWDGVELFTGIQPNMKKFYDIEYLSPDYIPNFNLIKSTTTNTPLVFETKNVEAEQEAKQMINILSPSDEEKKITTLLLTKNNNLKSTITPSSNIPNCSEFEVKDTDNRNQSSEISAHVDISLPQEENKNVLLSFPSSNKIHESKNVLKASSIPSSNSKITKNEKPKRHLKHSKSSSSLGKEKQTPLIRKTKSLSNLDESKKNHPSKHQQKQKFLKKLKHKKQPKIIYPSIPVNPDLSFTPLYKKDINESRIKSRVKHADMENTYKKLKIEMQQKSK